MEALARRLGVAVSIHAATGGGYTVDHSGAIFIVDPAAQISAILTGPYTVDGLRTDFARVVAAAHS